MWYYHPIESINDSINLNLNLEIDMKKTEAIEIIKADHEAGSSKDDIASKLFEAGVAFSDIPKYFKESGVKFRRSKGSTWKDITVEAFLEDPELTRDGMLEAIKDSVKDPDYYVKGYYDVFKKLVDGLTA